MSATPPQDTALWSPLDGALVAQVPAYAAGDSAADLGWALGEFRARLPRYAAYHAYLAGDHNLTFVTRGYRKAFQALLAGLRCNLCPRVVHALTDRLRLTGFEPPDTSTGTGRGDAATGAQGQAIAQRARGVWQAARLDRHANQIHTEAVAAGDAYLLVWPDPDEATTPRFYPQRADQVVVRYDAERCDTIVVAAKLWREGKRYRLNLYYPDRIEKYQSARDGDDLPDKASAFAPYAEDGAPWPVPNEYGRVPLFHFAFDAGIGQCGHPELKDIIPLQDALNKELCDLIVASEFGAFKQKYAIGVSADEDDEDAVTVGLDRFVYVANKDAKLGEFSANDLKNYTETIFAFAELMALAKGIPLHVLRMSGTIPSGEALKTAEAPLVARVLDTQTDFGDVWEDALAFALTIQDGTADAQLTATWAPAESRAEKDFTDTIAVKVEHLGVPQETGWAELGYSDEEIKTFKEIKAAAAPQLAPVAAAPGQQPGTTAMPMVAAPGARQGGQG